jgi:uncharacterized protein
MTTLESPIAETRFSGKPVALDGSRLHGYAAVFNQPSSVLFEKSVCKTPFIEVIAPGAFARTLRENPDVRSLVNHDRGKVIGRTKAGTLKLWEDEIGLAFDNNLPDTTIGRDAREDVKSGNIDGCSFFGYVIEDKVELRGEEPALRTVFEIDLVEITPVCSFPAYDTTSVAVRSRRVIVPEPVTSRPVYQLACGLLLLARD